MRIILAILFITLSGCTATYKQNILSAPTTKAVKGKTVIIATPHNGAYNGKEYISSGKMTALATKAAFAKFTNIIKISSNCSELACLQKLQSTEYDYYVVPEILHWEDRATEWSGIPDKVEIKISIYEGRESEELSSTIISGKSKWATFGGDHPQDLIEKPLNEYVQSLY
jgi:hypothetical protein